MRVSRTGGDVIHTSRAVVALALLSSLLGAPRPAHAGFRGAFDPITVDSQIYNRCEFGVFRPLPATDGVERFFSFTTRSPVPGREGSREIWLHRNVARAGVNMPLSEARVPLLRDVTGLNSYLDPAWSMDGRFLAYVQTNFFGGSPAVYVQEYAVSEDIAQASTPIGPPILVVPGVSGVSLRRPDWSPDGRSLAFESAATGLSVDIYTIEVFPAVGTPTRRTFDDRFAEQAAAFSPDGNRIAFTTNMFGPPCIAIADLTAPSPHPVTLVEENPAPVFHGPPDWSSDGNAIYYHAPKAENENELPDVWMIRLDTKAKCSIAVDDLTADSDVDVSSYVHETPEGIPFNYFLFTSMQNGPHVWRGQHIYHCVPPLPMAVQIQPNKPGSAAEKMTVTLSFPEETIAAGYQCSSFDGPLEGVRLRLNFVPSPTLDGLLPIGDPATGDVFPIFTDRRIAGKPVIDVSWKRSEVEELLRSHGYAGRNVPLQFEAYSNGVGRRFRGFAYPKLNAAAAPAPAPELTLKQNAPNPIREGGTSITFTTRRAGRVAVRVYNARGQLIRALTDSHFPAGTHHLVWDGRDDQGDEAPSGTYYARAATATRTEARVKMVLIR
jgi:hypothetical protein